MNICVCTCILNCIGVCFLTYGAIKRKFPDPVARQLALPSQPFCATFVGGGRVVDTLSTLYEGDRTWNMEYGQCGV